MRCREWFAVLVLAMWPASGALAADDKPPPGWAAFPTRAELAATETEARKTGVFARAVVRCNVADDGALTGCTLVRETPLDGGLGKGLLALVPKYRRVPPGSTGPRQLHITNSFEPMDTPPDWLKRPTPEQLLEVFPAEAYKRGISGRAVISCLGTVQGALSECYTLDESPGGMGFGGAAIALTPQFLMKPAKLGGKPVQSAITIPVSFKLGGAMPPVADAKKVMPANVAWALAPTFADVAAAYPKKARAEGKGGRVTLSCGMTEAGRLKDCQVAASEPFGYGFDTAGKSLAKFFAFGVTSDADRKATHDITVHLPITFDPTVLGAAAPAVGKPTWAAIPNDQQITAAFSAVKVPGVARVALACKVLPGGTVGECSVASESPADAGVGAAAMSLVPTFRLSTWTSEGLPVVGGQVRIPLRYEPDPAPARP